MKPLATRTMSGTEPRFGTHHQARGSLGRGGHLAAISVPPNRTPWLWDLDTGTVTQAPVDLALPDVHLGPDGRYALIVSPYGRQVVVEVGSRATIAEVDAATGSSTQGAVWQWVSDPALLFTSDARGRVYRWDLAAKKVEMMVAFAERGVADLSLSPDAGRLAIARPNGGLELWSVGEDRRLAKLHEGNDTVSIDSGPPNAVTFSPDGRWLLLQLARGETWWWKTPPERSASTLVAESTLSPTDTAALPVTAEAAFSADGTHFFTRRPLSAAPPWRTMVTVYAAETRPREVMTLKTREDEAYFSDWSAEGHSFWRATDEKVVRWDPTSDQPIGEAPRGQPDPSEELYAQVDGDLHITRVADGWRRTARRHAGGVVILDALGCLDGDLEAARSELVDERGQSPTSETITAASRDLRMATP